jgi:hypothetical protein
MTSLAQLQCVCFAYYVEKQTLLKQQAHMLLWFTGRVANNLHPSAVCCDHTAAVCLLASSCQHVQEPYMLCCVSVTWYTGSCVSVMIFSNMPVLHLHQPATSLLVVVLLLHVVFH